jgi:antitoxin YobK
MYSELITAINQAPFVQFRKRNQNGNLDEWIEKAEIRLGLALPPSYKWWLREYGGGNIAGEEIYSLYEEDFEEAVGGDIVYNAIMNEKNGVFDKSQLFICDSGNDEAWFFDTNVMDEEGEYPVYHYDYYDDSSSFYAKNFAEFLLKKIKENTTS